MKRFSSLLTRSKRSSSPTPAQPSSYEADSPEGTAARAVRLFCESGSAANRDEEVLHLPTIVDAAESSPGAASACAVQIRIFLQKPYNDKPHVQYNAIMLIRILSDNPGASFTKNFDDKFVKCVKTLLREGKDGSVQQIMRETLDALEANRSFDAGVQGVVSMWRREKGRHNSLPQPSQRYTRAEQSSRSAFGSHTTSGHLPPPSELVSRIEEARNSAKILIQFLQTTPPEEVFSNELIKEFADRCQSASRSMQTYINCDDPVPDDDTLQTLIETNEQLSLANSRHQRAILAARRAIGANASPGNDTSRNPSTNGAPQLPPQQPEGGLFAPVARPAETSFANFGESTYDRPAPAQPVPPMTPPKQPERSAVVVDSKVPARNDDYDDLYDSPNAARAPAAANPFADPAESAPATTTTSSVYSPASANSPSRPAVGPWHNSTITDSYIGRQASAADHLTMHARGTTGRAELDNNPNVGRT